ncbi:hypothetical protein HPULCUR_003292 [Helicostylum pulchrum]|uniref:Uncharacterized protein n=1 Tax=Helicostylum pulchrum TaxID=562976 RepID=A0ABP9XT04_9FUNG
MYNNNNLNNSFTNNLNSGIDRAELERNVVSVTAYPNRRSQRDIPATLEQAPRGFTPTGNNRTPSATLRIDSLITYLCAGVNRELSETQKKFIRLQFRSLARECRVNMKQNGYDFTFWNQFPEQLKLYYALKLEGAIQGFGHAIYRCKRQWAAGLLLQESMKSERQTAKRRQNLSQPDMMEESDEVEN